MQRIKFHSFAEVLHPTMKAHLHSKDQPCSSTSYTEPKNIIDGKFKICSLQDFPGGAVVENPPANAGDTGSSPGPGRSHMPRSN